MIHKLPFGLRIPILYVSHPLHRDAGLIERVHRAGGLGIIDRFNAGAGRVDVPAGVPHGVRVSLGELSRLGPAAGVRAAVVALEEIDRVAALTPGELAGAPVPVVVEVGSGRQAAAAEKAGAAALIARGNEGPGRVSETGGLVLLQEVLRASRLPVFLQGGVGLHTAAGASAAGAAGVVLDVHLLLAEDSAVASEVKDFLRSLTAPATVVLGESLGTPYRVYSRVATKLVRELRKVEGSLSPDSAAEYVQRIVRALSPGPGTAFDTDEVLLPLSEDIAVARSLSDRFGTAEAIVGAFGRRMGESRGEWPFHDDSNLAKHHGTRFPVVQGPMAHVSDNADFLAAVARGGALPFLAMGNMPAGIARDALRLAWEKTGGRFGVGLIGLEVNRHCYEAHLELMKEITPPFAILAAGSVDLARRIEALGTVCYLHCPAAAILSEALSAGLRHFVFEGAESGGHIGSLGSLDLWSANFAELEKAALDGLDLSEVTVLLAGGIATGRAAAFVAGMVEGFTARGLNIGLQMGTAYLATEEAVSTGAITRTYQELAVRSDRTVVIGRTVNTRARAAGSPMAATLVKRETQRVRDGVPLRERKELYEKDNLGALRLASKGCAIDPSTAAAECPVFYQLPPDEQLERGLYLMGQVVSLLDGPTTIEALHDEIITNGRRIYEGDSPAIEPIADTPEAVVEADREPIAVVGIGLRFPGADSPERFWDQIISRRSGIVEVPPDRWGNPDFYYHPDPKVPDKTYSRIGGFVTDFAFDPLKYRIPPAVAGKMDRTQQLAVSCTADALADAGLSPDDLKTARVGIVLGNSMGGENTDLYATRVGLPRTVACLEGSLDSLQVSPEAKKALIDEFRNRYLEGLPSITEDSLPGELANVISGRVANVFNLRGPNFTVDAACASSMAAVMNAVAALREGTIDYAITGGVDAAMGPPSFVKFCKIGALSPDGSRPFDESANGFVMGEGAGILVLKRLSDAIRDGDRIYCTILGIGSSSDGRGKGITAPNAAGQERAVQACLESAGVAPSSISLVEAHGTSTPVGDSTELGVLDKIFREAGAEPGSVGIGSVKSQIGHLKAAAGAAGMIKVILSLHHQTLPPTINVKKPNPCIDWKTSPLFLVAEPRPWPARNNTPRRAGVSAFGFGGTNFHVILQEHVPGLRVVAPSKQPAKSASFEPPSWPIPPDLNIVGEAWVIGGRDERDLAARAENLLGRLS
ncbi:MAG: nitronate monooxygenase, partial [Desulfomonile sp.]|nr:nitronate monooxygenase [Desulfomonile sp.]